MDGEVGETSEFFSLPGPTLPGRMSSVPFAPRAGLLGVGLVAVCANNGAANRAAKAVVSSNFFIGNPLCL